MENWVKHKIKSFLNQGRTRKQEKDDAPFRYITPNVICTLSRIEQPRCGAKSFVHEQSC
jgi:hypothetical protein